MLSLAGRVQRPKPQPVPVRIGGFGGVQGLAEHLRRQAITHLVDATHPFAAQMSAHAVAAARQAGVPLLALTRPPWRPQEGDRWQSVADVPAAVAALAGPARRIMLALGRMHLPSFARQPQHHYLLRLVDPPEVVPPLPRHVILLDRGPFDAGSDLALMRAHGIEVIVCKNAGGSGAEAKLIAARRLGLPVIMIERPVLPARPETFEVASVMDWLTHADLGV